MGREKKKHAAMKYKEEEQRFRELYAQGTELPKGMKDRLRIASCLSYQEEQQVYLAEDENGHYSVLKRATGSRLALLKKEAENLQNVRFSFFPRFQDWAEENGEGWLQREYISGDTLWEQVEKNGPFTPQKADELATRICVMAQSLHFCTPPVIHRDIKPQNIVMTPEGNLFFIDVGTARQYREDAGRDTVLVGTRLTAAPEQYGYRQTDCRTDIYALGVLYLYLLTGYLDIQKAGALNLISPARRQVIEKCTRLDPGERYQNCGELMEALKAADNNTAPGTVRKKLFAKAMILAAAFFSLIAGISVWRIGQADNSPYQFRSEIIGQAVREQLGKEEGDVTRKELLQIDTLRICGNHILKDGEIHSQYGTNHTVADGSGYSCDISDETGSIENISDCAYMKNLRKLVLDNQQIIDISPLKELPLESVSLCGNPILDLAPLKGKETLEELRIEDTNVKSLTEVSGCKSLRKLGIACTVIEDLNPITHLQLEEVTMLVPGEGAMEILAELPLKKLIIHSWDGEIDEAAGQITSLESLTIYSYWHSTLEPLLGLTNLKELNLYGSGLSSLEGIGNFKELDSLGVGNTRISDLTPLEEAEKISNLYVENTAVMDFSVLKDLQELHRIKCDDIQLEEIRKIISDPWFVIDSQPRTAEDQEVSEAKSLPELFA
ncbi:MAG: protein kinase [Eubacteriales bacterium]|nr:protein kinase [Eubacteriales bacterium]